MDPQLNGGEHDLLSELDMPLMPRAVAEARTSVRACAERLELSADRTDDLLIAVSEACTNAMEAQASAGVDEPVIVRCVLLAQANELAIEVEDRAGAGFDERTITPRPPRHDPGHLDVERGWGIQLMRELVDRVEFDHTPTGTVVRLVMSL